MTTDTTEPTPRGGPLSGLVVVDLTRVLAGPYATMVLADLGARVIKVETPAGGDDARSFGPFVGGKSGYFMSINRGKQSIALNLKDDADRATFEKLLDGADIVVENFRPGAMEKLGYGWDTLHARWPRLIYAAISGFGHSGPYTKRPAYDLVVQAMGGIMSITGQPGGEPTRVGSATGDITAGLFGAIGILAAVNDRHETGAGRMVDVGMFDSQVAILENAIARYFATGHAPVPIGNRHPSITPFESFVCADGSFVAAAGNDALFKTLCDAIGRADLAADPRFASNDQRTAHHTELKHELERTFAGEGVAHWLAVFEAAGVPCGPINSVDRVVADPHVAARTMMIEAHDPVAGRVRMAGNPVKVSGYDDPATRAPAPELDEHRDAIFAAFVKKD
jgi:CoA:oxalate CoA-transferase